MNKSRLLKLAAHITSPEIRPRFNMHWFFDSSFSEYVPYDKLIPSAFKHECGTSMCIAGWALALFTKDKTVTELGRNAKEAAAKVLGLSPLTAHELFIHGSYAGSDPDQAARTIRHLVATGKVDWEVK